MKISLRNFISSKYGASYPGCLTLWSKSSACTNFFSAAEIDYIVEEIEQRKESEDLYFGLGTQAEKLPSDQRGSADTVAFIPGFVADIDCKSPDKPQKNYPESKDEALKILRGFGLQPTCVVDTGNGLHAHWDLENGLTIQNAESLECAKELSSAFGRALRQHFNNHGREIDNTSDIVRNYRIPGTFNHKNNQKKLVTLLEYNPACRLSLEALKEMIRVFMDDPRETHKLQGSRTFLPADHEQIIQKCEWYRERVVKGAATCEEPNWYAGASISARCADGEKVFHAYSAAHPGYNQREASKKLRRALEETGPRTCKAIRYDLGNDKVCAACPYFGKITSPIQLGQNKQEVNYSPEKTGPIPLGYARDGSYVIRDPVRNIILQATSNQLLSHQYLLGLASSDFWFEQFGSGKRAAFDAAAAGEKLIELCKAAGPFDPTRVRGRGIWIEGNKEIINLGGPILLDTKFQYLCFEPLDVQKCDHFETQRLLDLLKLFNWKNPQDAILFLGWLAVAPICGVLSKRLHCFNHGPPRCGKTTLHNIASHLLSPLVIPADGQSTEAGIRQRLGPDSMAIVIDEFESDHNQGRLKAMIKLARSSYSSDSPLYRGTPEGKALQFSLRAMFYFSAVNPVGMEPADESRFVMLEILMHDNDEGIATKIGTEEAFFVEKGPEWCGYMVSHAAKINPSIRIFRQAMPGMDLRYRDNMATLFAGAFIALHGKEPSLDEAKEWTASFADTLHLHGEALDRDDTQECLNYFFAHVIDKYPVSYWVAEELNFRRESKPSSGYDSARILSILGLKLRTGNEEPGLIMQNGSPGIEKIFSGTKWGSGAWQKVLRKIPGAFSPRTPVYFSGTGKKSRAIGLPLEVISSSLNRPMADGDF
jgi:hypothetical protein